jgi:hypothetical protein
MGHAGGDAHEAARGEQRRQIAIERIAGIHAELAGNDGHVLFLGVPVRRDLVAGRKLQPDDERAFLRRTAEQYSHLGTRWQRWRPGAPGHVFRRDDGVMFLGGPGARSRDGDERH